MLHNEKPLADPSSYCTEILVALGKKFLITDKPTISDEIYAELGAHFIRVVNGEKTSFSKALKNAIHLVKYTHTKNFNCGSTLTYFGTAENAHGNLQNIATEIDQQERELEQSYLKMMQVNSTSTMGFIQAKILLDVASEATSPFGIDMEKHNQLVCKVFADLNSGREDKIKAVIRSVRSKFDAANAMLFALHVQKLNRPY